MFRCEGEVWTLSFGERTVQLRDTKGMRDIAALLCRPGREIAVHELATSPERSETAALEVADRTAIAAYRRRLIDLEQERADAEAMHDLVRAERAAIERDAVIEELAAVSGLGGRPPAGRFGHRAECAKRSVIASVRRAASDRAGASRTRPAPSDLGADRHLLPL